MKYTIEQQAESLHWTCYQLLLEAYDDVRLGSTEDKEARIARHIANAEKHLAAIKRARVAKAQEVRV
ncbi:MAG TPA: hypothetical protein VFK47_14500 [Ktedonobacteraceae bacterium]|nr:hypothetical protein [Ktedonobacteraceae bacterium]